MTLHGEEVGCHHVTGIPYVSSENFPIGRQRVECCNPKDLPQGRHGLYPETAINADFCTELSYHSKQRP